MLVTNKNILKKYTAKYDLWLGIPSIEVTKNGRTFLTFYSGGTREEIGNYCVLVKSNDGKNFKEHIAICYEEGYRCFDPCLWIDPLGRLWFTWARCPEDAVYAAICEDPDADEIVFGEEFRVGEGVMMNKPTVLSTGEWLFPIAVWSPEFRSICESNISEQGSFAYSTYNNGKSFRKIGFADVRNRSFDEHMFLEMNDGRIRCFVRTNYGIGAADSFDQGIHWSEDFNTGYGGPCSRFHIKRLPSGRVLLINHFDFSGRNNLTAMLSEDDGKTFPYKLLLDSRNEVSYPDATVGADGMIHITYDRERGAFKQKLSDIMGSAREILTACICEEDIISGYLVNGKSYLKNVAYKLTDYEGDIVNPFNEKELFNDEQYANYLLYQCRNEKDIVSRIFEEYNVNCSNLHNIEAKKFDALINEYKAQKEFNVLNEIIAIVRKAGCDIQATDNIVDKIREYIIINLENEYSIEDIANHFNYSIHYIYHIFKRRTGLTINEFKISQKIKKARILLITSDVKISEIAASSGFENSSYFAEVFKKNVGVSPREYRAIFK